MKKMFILMLVSIATGLGAMEPEQVRIEITNHSLLRVYCELYTLRNPVKHTIEPGKTIFITQDADDLFQIAFSTNTRSSITWNPGSREFLLELNATQAIQLPMHDENPQLYLTIDQDGTTRGSLAKPAAPKEPEISKNEPSVSFQFLIDNNLIDINALRIGFQTAIDNYFGPNMNFLTEKKLASELLSFTEIASKINQNIIDPNQVNCYDEPLLYNASGNPLVNFVKYLIDRGANPNSITKNGNTPLDSATFSILLGMYPDEALQIMDILLKAKANPNINAINQPLIRLLQSDKPAAPKATELLLKYGADPSIPDAKGETAYDYAQAAKPMFNAIKKMLQRTKYTILGVDRNASTSQIKQTYRDLALKFHPDKAGSLGLTPDQAQRKFIEIKDAYETLSDPNKRTYYDYTIK
jgi:hypothetical protein